MARSLTIGVYCWIRAHAVQRGDLKPRVIRDKLRMYLDKMVSGGRLGEAYFRRGSDR